MLHSKGVICIALYFGSLLVGCGRGPELGSVEGTVRLDGEPVHNATVIFQPHAGATSYGLTDDDGRYHLKFSEDRPGATIGRHKVTIETFRLDVDGEDRPIEHPETIPAKYNRETQLSREVQAGSQSFDFELTTEQ